MEQTIYLIGCYCNGFYTESFRVYSIALTLDKARELKEEYAQRDEYGDWGIQEYKINNSIINNVTNNAVYKFNQYIT